MTPESSQITELLIAWRDGDRRALEALTPLVYQQLHRLAEKYMLGERPNHTLQATALVPEESLITGVSRRFRPAQHRFNGGTPCSEDLSQSGSLHSSLPSL